MLLLVLSWSVAASGATFVVTKEEDDDGPCEPDDCALREAILAGNAAPGPDVVVLPPGVYRLTIPGTENDGFSGDLDIRDDTDLFGDPLDPPTIVGDGTDRVLEILRSGPGTVELSHLVITGGRGAGGGGVRAGGSFAMRDCTIEDNTSASFGGGLLFSSGPATIERTTFRGNTAAFSGGGFHRFVTGIFDRTQLINSTVVDNHAPVGGGVFVSTNGPFDFINVTIADNTSDAEFGSGVAWELSQRLSFFNTLIWNNNCGSIGAGPAQTNGHNMEGPSATCFLATDSDRIGVADLGLGPLGDYGGPTPVRPLLAGSPAIDAALDADCPATDQRLFPRPEDGDFDGFRRCDIGAVEIAGASPVDIPMLGARGGLLLVGLLGLAGVLALRKG